MTFRRFSLGIVLLAAGCEVAAIVLSPPVSEPLREAGIGALAATGLFLADRMPVRIGPNRRATLGTAPILFAALLLSPPVAAAFTGGAFLLSNRVLGRRWINSAYNAAQVVLITLVAGFAGGPLSRLDPLHVLRAVLAAVLLTATSTLLAGVAIALFRKESLPAVMADGFRVSWAQDLADGGIGVAMAVLFVAAPIAAVLPLAALPLVYRMNRALEEELRSREQVAAILAAQRRFLTDVAHNVGNPLATIRTNLGLLRVGRLAADERVAVEDARNESERLVTLWKRLQVLAQTDEDLPLKLSRVNLVDLANDVLHAYEREAEQKGIAMEVETPLAIEATVDADLIRQAAANLVENAIRHGRAGTRVTIRVARVGQLPILEVVDTGPGIPAERVAAIFDRFQRGPEGGTGLGLSIARSAVERNGGRIAVESRLGSGSRFTITLPRPPAAA